MLLALLLVACSDKRPPVPPTATLSPPPVAISAPAPDAAPEAQVIYALQLLRAYYVDDPDPNPLLEAAWQGALEAARDAAFEPPAGLQFSPTAAAGAEAEFGRALRTLLSLAPPTLDPKEVVFGAVTAMTKSLHDDHTYFMLPEAYDLYQANAAIGLSYSGVRSGTGLLAWYVYEDGPAAKAGIVAGDVILTIDGKPAARDPDDDERELYEAGVQATLKVDRPGVGQFDVVAVPERSQRRILDWRLLGDIAYLRLYRFPPPQTLMPGGQTLASHLDDVLAEVRQDARALVLDLRNNPGGSEIVAANVAGRLGLTGPLVENRRRGLESATVNAIGSSGLNGMPLAVLINENSASSSELAAAALQQAGLARLFGEKTAGIVNTARAWSVAGGGLFITTERAYAGVEKVYLDRQGVLPDEGVSLSRSALAAGRDTQLETALEWLRSKADAAAGVR